MDIKKASVLSILTLLVASAARAQQVPIYQVTVTERTVKAVNYQYRNGPTRIDFRGTVLLPEAKGEAVVESKAGRTEVDVKVDRLAAPTRFGTGLLTYVLWAITPEGHAKSFGELVADGGDHARLHVTTDLQAFGMIVTAEPYSAVRQPGDVVVMENEIRPDTIGRIEPIQAKYELLSRGKYSYDKSAEDAPPRGPKVSMAEYESLLELYQAQNAVQIAQSEGADQYASETFAKAQELLKQARELQVHKGDRSTLVTIARQAAQTAEDARAIARTRKRDADLVAAQKAVKDAEARRIAAESEADRLRAQLTADHTRPDTQGTQHAEAASIAPPPSPQPPAVDPTPEPREQVERAGQRERRAALLRDLSSIMTANDTPRGIVVVIADDAFQGAEMKPETSALVSRVAQTLASQRGLNVQVLGHLDTADGGDLSYKRAAEVRSAMIRAGMNADMITAQGLGNSHPLGPNGNAESRRENRRVEIAISGDSIGTMPGWDKSYSLK